MDITLNLDNLFKLKNVENRLKFLRTNGFKYYEARYISYENPKSLKLDQIARLCLAFNCTPNDLFAVAENSKSAIPKGSPLNVLIKKPVADIPFILKNLSPEEYAKLAEQISSLSSKNE